LLSNSYFNDHIALKYRRSTGKAHFGYQHKAGRNRSLPPKRNGFPLYMVASQCEGVVREAVPR